MDEQLNLAAGPDKNKLRQKMLEARNGMPAEDRTEKSAAVCRYLSEWLTAKAVKRMMCYAPFRSELDTRPLIEWAWQSGIEVVLPRSEPADRSMTLHLISRWEDLIPGAYGIPEPDSAASPALAEQDWPGIIIVPGVAFDSYGGRLGYGGGYYDRFAERLGNERIWMGAAFDIQFMNLEMEKLPMQPHDKRMDGLVTESGLRLF
ncbi:5-formyltetrahydrofolate cyclo-ligase [Paenibacillus gorillae]|uniref:5-formyltetrahydrofolate cyclo-ligase n=1 Tax=Paenibacillus gorillae TaxID=1243662 RepID=UPI0005AB34DB|nr:5-formyltetrahydrofolate cyclo-ligase [Paenibacillus gorillae]